MTLLPWLEDDAVAPLPIYARSGWEIPQPSQSLAGEEIADAGDVDENTRRIINGLSLAKRQSLLVRSVSPHFYNCVGMAFANRRAWIEPEWLYDILREDGYTRVTNPTPLACGDIALYCMHGKPAHAGLVAQIDRLEGRKVNVRVLSKWGRVGEVEHPVHDVPEFCGRLHSYWSERVPQSD